MDVKSTFLNGELEEEVYVAQLSVFIVTGEKHKVLQLWKVLYGLQQAPQAWNANLKSTLRALGFKQSVHEHVTYRCGHGNTLLLLGVYVDDLIITGLAKEEIHLFKVKMKN